MGYWTLRKRLLASPRFLRLSVSERREYVEHWLDWWYGVALYRDAILPPINLHYTAKLSLQLAEKIIPKIFRFRLDSAHAKTQDQI
jgi:hypothetical protein